MHLPAGIKKHVVSELVLVRCKKEEQKNNNNAAKPNVQNRKCYAAGRKEELWQSSDSSCQVP